MYELTTWNLDRGLVCTDCAEAFVPRLDLPTTFPLGSVPIGISWRVLDLPLLLTDAPSTEADTCHAQEADEPRARHANLRDAVESMQRILSQAQARRACIALRRHKSVVIIQRRCRGIIVRKRLASIRVDAFQYNDGELDSLLCVDVLVDFDEEESDSSWSPRRPNVEPLPSHETAHSESTLEPPDGAVSPSAVSHPSARRESPSKGDTGRPKPNRKKAEWQKTMRRRKSHLTRKGSSGSALRARR